MKHLIGKTETKKVPFMGDEVEIRKLSIKEVLDLQSLINSAAESGDQLEVLRGVLRLAVVGAEEMTNEEFDTFPPADLNAISEEIISYCGLGGKAEPAGN